jgi:hypothetical protein
MLVLAHADDERDALVRGVSVRRGEEAEAEGCNNEAHHGALTFPLRKRAPSAGALEAESLPPPAAAAKGLSPSGPLVFAMIVNRLLRRKPINNVARDLPMSSMRVYRFILFAALAAAPGPLAAEPQAPTTEQSADVTFGTSFIGKIYDDELEVEGWEDLGGGLVAQPIFVHEYQREDGTFLVLTSRQLSKETNTSPASYEVADALIVRPPASGVEFTISCVQAPDETLRFMGEAKGDEQQEWWSDVRRAWEIVLDTGKIVAAKTKGIRCTNVSWGQ